MCILKYDKEKKPKKANNSLEEKTDQRKRALEVIELIAVAVICIIMYFRLLRGGNPMERGLESLWMGVRRGCR